MIGIDLAAAWAALLLAAASSTTTAAPDSAILRERTIVPNATHLGGELDLPRTWDFQPFPDVRIRVLLTDDTPGFLAGRVLSGFVPGHSGSWARLVLNEEAVYADVHAPLLGTFEVRSTAEGAHVVRQVDRSQRPVCDGVLEAQTTSSPGFSKFHSPRRVPARIDVMIVYTPSALTMAGGLRSMEATAESYVAYANAAYAASGVHQRLRLVHCARIGYAESGNSLTDLARLRNPNDGFMDDVHPLRDAVGADCVCLIATSGSAGVAYLMADPSPSFEDRAFSAIGHDVGGLVFAHELGHNMGCGHNNGPGAPPAAFCFSYGHRTPDGAWRTIMSSPPGTFVDVFSNPALSIGGFPLGVSGVGCPTDGAENAATLNRTAAIVAGFRPTILP